MSASAPKKRARLPGLFASTVLLLLAAAAILAPAVQAAQEPERVLPAQVYYPTDAVGLIPRQGVEGKAGAAPLEGVDQPEDCTRECAARSWCSYVWHCGRQGGCDTGFGSRLSYQQCQLLIPDCSKMAKGVLAETTSGFPIHHRPPHIADSFPTALARGVLGADIQCPMSEVPGICAFSDLLAAAAACVTMGNACKAVTFYANGTDGCSATQMCVLKSEVPTDINTFISSDVYTILLADVQSSMRDLFLFADEAELDLPSDEEAEQAETSYKGCMMASSVLYRGDEVGVVDDVQSPQACCRACAARNSNLTEPLCTVWNYCGQEGGCKYVNARDASLNIQLAQGQCELRSQEVSPDVISVPPPLLAKGESAAGFSAGLILTLWAPQLPGYESHPGEAMMMDGSYPCPGSLRPQTGECVKLGTLDELASYCDDDPQCKAFAYRIGTAANQSQADGQPIGIGNFKNTTTHSTHAVFPTSVLYMKDEVEVGMTTGALVGIIVGSIAATALMAGAAGLLWRRRRRRLQGEGTGKPGWTSSSLDTSQCGPLPRLHMCNGFEGTPTRLTPMQSDAKMSSGGSSTADPIPELVGHVAAQDAAAMQPRGAASSDGEGGVRSQDLLLPPHLQEWVVESEQISFMRRADGQLWEIGAGASGKVYRVQYLGEVVAAKQLDIGVSDEQREAFAMEAQLLEKLRHPNVVGFVGVSFMGTKGLVLLEYCEGRDLHAALQLVAAGSQERVFGWYQRGKRVALEVAKALNFLHSKGVVHLDVKSPNVLLTACGTAKLADVGFSRVKQNTFLSTMPLVGTFAWVAPEVLLGNERCTQAVDIYSFGVLMWEIITGERPQRGDLRPPRVPEECPQEVHDLMSQCLMDKPQDRPSAVELVQQLEQAVLRRPRSRQQQQQHATVNGAAPSSEGVSAAGEAAAVGTDGRQAPAEAVVRISVPRPSMPSPFAR